MTFQQEARANLVKRLRKDAEDIALSRDSHMGLRMDLRQAANEIEALGLICEAGREVFQVASRKGLLFITDEDGSDKLVAFFVPAAAMNALAEALRARL